MDNLESRIRALEASNRRQRYSITALAAVIVGGTLIVAMRPAGNATFDRVTCKNLSVIDDNGKQRISAFTDAAGDAVMQWLDKDEKTRISTHTPADGSAAMQWHDKDGKERIEAGTDTDGTVGLPTTDLQPKP